MLGGENQGWGQGWEEGGCRASHSKKGLNYTVVMVEEIRQQGTADPVAVTAEKQEAREGLKPTPRA